MAGPSCRESWRDTLENSPSILVYFPALNLKIRLDLFLSTNQILAKYALKYFTTYSTVF